MLFQDGERWLATGDSGVDAGRGRPLGIDHAKTLGNGFVALTEAVLHAFDGGGHGGGLLLAASCRPEMVRRIKRTVRP